MTSNDINHPRRVVLAITLCTILISLNFLEYYWQQISEFAAPIGLSLLIILFLFVCGKLISTFITLFKLRNQLTLKTLAPSIIYASTISLILCNPKILDASTHQSPVKYRGCYEGTMNTGTIVFRLSGQFEYRHVGFFGLTTFEKGTWHQLGDTLFIQYRNQPQEFVGSKLIISSERFIKTKVTHSTSVAHTFIVDTVRGRTEQYSTKSLSLKPS